MLEILEMVSIESLKRYLFGHANPISGIISGSLVRLLVGKSYHTKPKDRYSLLTNDPTNNHTHWIWTSKKIGLKAHFLFSRIKNFHSEVCRKYE